MLHLKIIVIKMLYSIRQRVEVITLFFRSNDSIKTGANAFNELHRNRHVSYTYIGEIVTKC